MHKKILIATHDPGGAKAMLPVIRYLSSRPNDFTLKVLASTFAQEVLKSEKIEAETLPANISFHFSTELFDHFSPDIVFTGTSWNSNAEQFIRNCAAKSNVISFVMLDFWSNYSMRWADADYPLAKMKEKVLIMDEATRAEMLAEGFLNETMITVGHPFLEEIFQTSKDQLPPQKQEGRKKLLFLSQPFECLNDFPIHPIRLVADTLEKYNQLNPNCPINLEIRLHPKEQRSQRIQTDLDRKNFHYTQVHSTPPSTTIEESLEKANIVIGYNTIALFEARARNINVGALEIFPFNTALKDAMRDADIILGPTQKEFIETILHRPDTSSAAPPIYTDALKNTLLAMGISQ